MNELRDKLIELFDQLITHPEKADEYASLIKEVLNGELADERKNFHPIECDKVYTSHANSCDPFYLVVIPDMPTSGNTILATDFIETYCIDIDLDNLVAVYNKYGLNAKEIVAWLFHELYANVLTDTTFLRYKRLLISHYDTQNKAIVATHNNLGYMCWFGVFGNTEKVKITESTSDTVSNELKVLDLANDWNCALDKYVIACGGDYNIVMPQQLAQDDKKCLEVFNKLARKYSAYAIKYANTDYNTLARYLSSKVGSALLKDCIMREPEQIAAIPEKFVYTVFDSQKLIREANEAEYDEYTAGNKPEEHICCPYCECDELALQSHVDELELDAQNIYSQSEKLFTAAKLKDILREIEKRIADDSTNEHFLELRERVFQIASKVSEVDVSEVSELELR